MQTFLQENNSSELILFFNGWGMDEKPFIPIKSSSDILFVSDYNDLSFSFDFSKYKKINMIAFSCGVFMSSFLQDKLPKIESKVAVNGILNLFDKKNGIPENVLNQMENLTVDNAHDFRKKIIFKEAQLNLFNKNQPSRDLISSLAELSMLKKYYTENQNPTLDFDKVIIGKNDMILPPNIQLDSWKNHKNVQQFNGGHFIFYNFNNLADLL